MSDQLLPLVTVITPAYNRADYLPETVESILNQDYPNIEYIILDDGSTDDTPTVLAQYAGQDQIIIERHDNMGEVATVNKAYRMARGDYITIINSDDPVLPGYIRAAVEFMQAHPELLAAYPDWDMIDQDSNLIRNRQTVEYDYLYMLRKHYCVPGPGTIISRRALEILSGRDLAFRYAADYDYWLQLGLRGPMGRIPATLATFRVHPGSATVSHKGQAMVDEHIALIDKVYRQNDLPSEILAIQSESYAAAYFVAGTVWLETDTPQRAQGYFLRAIWHYPASLWRWPLYQRRLITQHILPDPIYKSGQRLWRLQEWIRFQLRRVRYKLRLILGRGSSR